MTADSDLFEEVTRIGRPWHGVIRNNTEETAATLTLANGATKPWPAALTSGDCWLLRRPDWPAADPVEGDDGRLHLDYCLQPTGTGADPWLLAYADDGVPWLIGIAPSILPAAGSDPERINYHCWGLPYGRIGQAPSDWIAMSPTAPGADSLPSAPYMPLSSVLPHGPLEWDPGVLMSVSSDGRKWLFKVMARDIDVDPEYHQSTNAVLGIYELVFTGGSGVTSPPTFSLVNHLSWGPEIGGTYQGYDVGYSGVVVHAWYTASDAIETVRIDKVFTPNDGGIRGSLRWRLMAGARLLGEAYIRATPPVTLNGQPIPGAVTGEYFINPPAVATDDVRSRHIMYGKINHADSSGNVLDRRRLRLLVWGQTKSVISLYADATNYEFTDMVYSAWLGCGTPGTQDPTTITDTATNVVVAGGLMSYDVTKYAGAWHPVTGQLLRCQTTRVAFV